MLGSALGRTRTCAHGSAWEGCADARERPRQDSNLRTRLSVGGMCRCSGAPSAGLEPAHTAQRGRDVPMLGSALGRTRTCAHGSAWEGSADALGSALGRTRTCAHGSAWEGCADARERPRQDSNLRTRLSVGGSADARERPRQDSNLRTRLSVGGRADARPGALGRTRTCAHGSAWEGCADARERPRQDSNLRTRLRRPMLYPLSYEGGCRRDS